MDFPKVTCLPERIWESQYKKHVSETDVFAHYAIVLPEINN